MGRVVQNVFVLEINRRESSRLSVQCLPTALAAPVYRAVFGIPLWAATHKLPWPARFNKRLC